MNRAGQSIRNIGAFSYSPGDLGLSAVDLKVQTTYTGSLVAIAGADLLIALNTVIVGATTVGTAVLRFTPFSRDGETALSTAIDIATGITVTASAKLLIALPSGVTGVVVGTGTIGTAINAMRPAIFGKFSITVSTAFDSATSAVASLYVQGK